jgi:C_GCAxxG_C_C family probable redox protein
MSKDVSEIAVGYFTEGYNCAESVFKALSEALGLEGPYIPKIASGFGAGMARHGEACGALSGAILALGMVFGRETSQDSREGIYGKVDNLVRAFEYEFGSVGCIELTGCDLLTPEGKEAFAKDQLHGRLCARLVAFAAREGMRLLEK